MSWQSIILAFLILETAFPDQVTSSCGPPPDSRGMVYDIETKPPYPVGTNISYKCDYGFTAKGQGNSISCVHGLSPNSSMWTTHSIICTPQSCGDPGMVLHAKRVGSLFSFPHNVTFECDEGYRLVGSKKRFCLPTGQWSGAVPVCNIIYCMQPRDPENGKVRHVSLEYGSELHYECYKGYRLNVVQRRRCSSEGEWTGEDPVCAETVCFYPDAPAHGNVSIVGGKPVTGSIALFNCDPGYDLIGSPTSRCLKTGDWTFPSPKCAEPCSIPNVANGALGEYIRNYRFREEFFRKSKIGLLVRNGTALYLKCDSNDFEIAGLDVSETMVICKNGNWSHHSVCIPASCRNNPKEVENGKLTTKEIRHGTKLTYLCNKHFLKTRFGNVTCEYGVWKGMLPVCSDTRCHLDPPMFKGTLNLSKKVFFDGESFSPSCSDGHQLRKRPATKITCSKGKWEGDLSPCIPVTPETCIVPKYDGGNFARKIWVQKFIWTAKKAEYSPVPPGSRIAHGSSIHIFCLRNLTFQGMFGEKSGEIFCDQGNWIPPPHCNYSETYIRVGSSTKQAFSMITTAVPNISKKAVATVGDTFQNTRVFSTQITEINTHADTGVLQESTPPSQIVSGTITTSILDVMKKKVEGCSCSYVLQDDNLIAFAGNERLFYQSKVKKGCTVHFHCIKIGYQRLVGPKSIKCTDCSWHSSEFPICASPQIGDAVILLELFEPDRLSILPSGVISLPEDAAVNITCHTLGIPVWPVLVGPGFLQPKYEEDSSSILKTVIIVKKTRGLHTGKYECRTSYGHHNYIYIKIQELKVPDPPEFTAINPFMSSVFVKWKFVPSTNSVSGFLLQWFDKPSDVKQLASENVLRNEYEIKDLEPSTEYNISLQSFNAHGSSPAVSKLVKTLEESKGGCIFHTVFDVLPVDVEPEIQNTEISETVPVGTTIQLTCGNVHMRPVGKPVVMCDVDGKWLAPDGVQCIVACGPINKPDGSNLHIEPQKEIYRFGESVKFSCPPGQMLNSSTARVMCLRGVWSKNIVPHCINL